MDVGTAQGSSARLESGVIIDALKEKLDANPFVPFTVFTSGGRSYPVTNPGLVVLMKSSVFIAQPKSDRAIAIPYLHVSTIEEYPNDGQIKRRKAG